MRSAFAGWPSPTPGTWNAERRSISTTSTPRRAKAVAAVSPPTPPPTTSTRRILLMVTALPAMLPRRKLRLLRQRVGGAAFGRHFADSAQITLAGEHDPAIAGAQSCDEIADCSVEIGCRNDARDETNLQRLVGIEFAAAKNKIECALCRK